MKRILLYLLLTVGVLSSCMKHDFDGNNNAEKEQINDNVYAVFGVIFDQNHDWCTTSNGTVSIDGIPSDVSEIQLLALETDGDATSLRVLNSCKPSGDVASLAYDASKNTLGLYVSFLSPRGMAMSPVNNGKASYVESTRALTRAVSVTLPNVDLRIGEILDSYASSRGWIAGEKLYGMSDYVSQQIQVQDYSATYKEVFRSMVFSYFKNGRAHNNLPLVKASGLYNDNAYPITTGKDPILVSPVYKNDGGYKEVVNSDLYYYYFKESDVSGDFAEYIKGLPKYKAIVFSQCIKADDEICKHVSYPLVYWGDGVPNENTVGTYQFPEGYKIGFMVRAKTTAEGGKKQGELYGDGRLNNDINNYASCNFKSSKLGTDGPRAAWLGLNGRTLLCFESGTDSDFNDIIMEVEGGVEPIIIIPEFEDNYYTFCFEDTKLGDYDMNDVVIKARRLNETQVEYSVVACGAYDNLYIHNINGNVINSDIEVHAMFNQGTGFINTVAGQNFSPITDVVDVPSSFSFLDKDTQPYIVDKSNGNVVKISNVGEDPHGIMIPYDFKYPLEKTCVKDAYKLFNTWGTNRVTATDWYKYYEEGTVF